jgi:nucleotide-binding universal stress UspA family protein
MVSRILVANDGSQNAKKALDLAISLARCTDSKLDMISVFPVSIPALGVIDIGAADQYIEAQDESIKVEYARVVSGTKASAKAAGIDIDCHIARGGSADEIVSYACRINADLIVVGHRGLNAFQSLILGTTSERVVHTAKCSVLVVR